MKKSIKRFMAFCLSALMVLSLITGCGEQKGTIQNVTVSDEGLVEWDPVKGAESYNVVMIYQGEDGTPTSFTSENITETSYQLSKGFSIQISAVYPDGYEGPNYVTDYFGGAETPDAVKNGYFDDGSEISKYMLSLPTWDFVKSIDESSVKKESDGTVSFSSIGPDGNPVRFTGEDIEVNEDSIVLHKDARMMSLDSIGRIYGVSIEVSDPGDENNSVMYFGGYNVDNDPNPGTLDRMVFTGGFGTYASEQMNDITIDTNSFRTLQPNFIGVGVSDYLHEVNDYPNVDDVTISGCSVVYENTSMVTPFKELVLSEDNYGAYFEGDEYDTSRERFDPYNSIFDFRLYAIPELDHEDLLESDVESAKSDYNDYAAYATEGGYYKIDGIKKKDGSIVDRENESLEEGDALAVTFGKTEYDVPFSFIKSYEGAENMHDLVPYAFHEGTGDLKALVVPIGWQDETEYTSDTELDTIRKKLGRVEGENGQITDYTDEASPFYSLSKYYDTASYGKLNLVSYITEWYIAPHDFSEYKAEALDESFIDEVRDWISATYPDKDWSEFDKDGDGYFDAVVFLNTGDMSDSDEYVTISFGGAIQYRQTYGNELAGDNSRLGMNNVVNMNYGHLNEEGMQNTLIHEFGHGFGLIDYYDVSYSGRNAVGGYDMQSDNVGDWNAYSKYAVGWIEPKTVNDLASGESVELEIGSFAGTGDAIVIPAAGDGSSGPFSEYMLVDLFTPTGVNQHDAAGYGLGDTTAVQIYHVDARMEYRDFVSSEHPDMTPCPIGTVHFANDFKPTGCYNLELIQAGGRNTFTNPEKEDRSIVEPDDLFKAGDVFTTEKYSEFFKDGKFDNGKDFGYSIEVVSISGSGDDAHAVIKITKE